jgi:alpha-ketoglutarate-dependent taurine dioxygenase
MRLTIAGKNGSLHQFTQKVTNKHGEIIEYPKVKGERDPNNVKHWKWQITWKEKVDNLWRTRCLVVPSSKVRKVKIMIAQSAGLAEIQEFLR